MLRMRILRTQYLGGVWFPCRGLRWGLASKGLSAVLLQATRNGLSRNGHGVEANQILCSWWEKTPGQSCRMERVGHFSISIPTQHFGPFGDAHVDRHFLSG